MGMCTGQFAPSTHLSGYSNRKHRDHYDGREHDRVARVAGDASVGANFSPGEVDVDRGPVRLERPDGVVSKPTAPCETTHIPRRD
jgi:hypothetical protein